MTDDRAQDQTYLGDGVYASHDGYQIWLAVNHHENVVVALDANVVQCLIRYATKLGMINEPA
jgi:hypothetical protein